MTTNSIYSILAYPKYYQEEFKKYSNLYPKVWMIYLPRKDQRTIDIATHAWGLIKNENLVSCHDTHLLIITVFESNVNAIKEYCSQNNAYITVKEIPYEMLKHFARCPGA